MSNERSTLPVGGTPPCSPAAIRTWLSALAAEAVEAGHPRAAVALQSVADLLSHPDLWEPAGPAIVPERSAAAG